MICTICTFFEGDYHYGVGSLANSLHRAGFRGTVYVGYRGPLPRWTKSAVCKSFGKWQQVSVLNISEGLELAFVPLTTDYHLTNYKPFFMLELLEGPAKGSDAIYYIDPDICVIQPWQFFQEWVSCGVALCEDVNSPLPQNHPRRIGWRRYFSKYGFQLEFQAQEYINAGFLGVSKQYFDFIRLWRDLQNAMADEIGTLAATKVSGGKAYQSKGFADCFESSDQDSLNAAIEASDYPISVIGKEAMGFKSGFACVPHALGGGKPWQKVNLMEAFRGRPPRMVDKVFWQNVLLPIQCFHPIRVMLARIDLMLAAALGRAWRRY